MKLFGSTKQLLEKHTKCAKFLNNRSSFSSIQFRRQSISTEM